MNKDIDIEKIEKVTRETMRCFMKSFQKYFIENKRNAVSKHEFISYNQCLMGFVAEAVLCVMKDDLGDDRKKEILLDFVDMFRSTIEQCYKSG